MSEIKRIDLAIVIPVYNSCDGLQILFEEIQKALSSIDFAWRLILVDDCSSDGSWNAIKAIAAEAPQVCGIRMARNVGQHRAIFVGLAQVEADLYVTMDDDLQHNPADIVAMLGAMDQPTDLIYARFKDRQHPWWKKLGSFFNDVTSAFLIKKPRGIYLSPFRLFRKNVRDGIIRYQGESIYLDGLILQTTNRIKEAIVQHGTRRYGESEYGVRKSASLWLSMALGFSLTPLRAVSFLGVLISIFGALGALYVFFSALGTDTPPGWASLLVTMIFLGGLQLLALGVIGEYLGRVAVAVLHPERHPVGEVFNLNLQSLDQKPSQRQSASAPKRQ